MTWWEGWRELLRVRGGGEVEDRRRLVSDKLLR